MEIQTYVSTAIAGVSLVYAYINGRRNNRREEELDTRELRASISELQARVDMIWNIMEKSLAIRLHHPNSPKRDALIEKFLNDDDPFTAEEWNEFRGLLDAIQNSNEPKDKHVAGLLISMLEERNKRTK